MSVRFVKSFSIYSAATSLLTSALVGALVAALVLAPPDGAEAAKKKKKKKQAAEELTNFLLGPEYSQWLLGAIARMATEAEVESFMSLTSDEDAAAFVEEFWAARGSGESVWPPVETPQALFETRSKEADTFYSEGPRRGRRSDRGAVFILYGEPEEVKYELSSRPNQGPIEVWVYSESAEAGLDGSQPERYYYFTKQGDYTVATIAPRRNTLRRPGGA